jgi:phosphoglycerate dehydrogenase-like enzyme
MTGVLILDPDADALAARVGAASGAVAGSPTTTPVLHTATALEALPTPALLDAEVLCAPPHLARQAILRGMARLRWVQSTWAGVTPVLQALRETRGTPQTSGQDPWPQVTSAKGLFGPRMAEYVFGWLTALERRLIDYRAEQRASSWRRLEQRDLCGRTLLLVGTGGIGAHLARVAEAFGLRVIGISRQGRPVPGFEQVDPPAALRARLAEADYVVSSLPDTPAARHVFDRQALAAMRADAIFINVGRGATVDDEALLECLHAGRLRAAVLDVFSEEPLPPQHPFWQAPRLYITPHVAAFTPLDGIASLFADNLSRYRAGRPLRSLVDPIAGY